jgi:hypothetical protein
VLADLYLFKCSNNPKFAHQQDNERLQFFSVATQNSDRRLPTVTSTKLCSVCHRLWPSREQNVTTTRQHHCHRPDVLRKISKFNVALSTNTRRTTAVAELYQCSINGESGTVLPQSGWRYASLNDGDTF